MTTEPFPAGNAGGRVYSPDYFDSYGYTTYPSNNATQGTTTTVKIGGTNYDNFPTPSQTNSVTIAYVESSVSQTGAIQFAKNSNGNGYQGSIITSTSPSCYNANYGTYYVDVSALIDGQSETIATDIVGTFSATNTLNFDVTSPTGQFPGSPTVIQLEVNVIPSSDSPFADRRRAEESRSPAFRR